MSFLNKTIDSLPFELHIPGYNYCGPGTKLAARLARNSQPVNGLDRGVFSLNFFYYYYYNHFLRKYNNISFLVIV